MIDAPPALQIPKLRVALAHDWLVGMRGGERVLDRLAHLFGPTNLYTLVNDGHHLTDAIARCRIVTSPLQHFPGASGKLRRHYLPLMPWAVDRLRIPPGSCDIVISTSSAVMKSIKPPVGERRGVQVPHLCYCHSPARYVWDLREDYGRGAGGAIRRFGLRAVRKRFQEWDRRTAARVTQFLANSSFTAQRIKQFYGREAAIVHPPVRTQFFTPDPATAREDHLLVVSALEPYKRVDLAIDAANREKWPLTIIGDGTQRRALQQLAGPTIQFLGRASDEIIRDHYRRARALLFPQVEDFGIVAAEAQSCGCPVIAYAHSGAADIVQPGAGVLFHKQTPDAMIRAIDELNGASVEPECCRRSASRFDEARFDREIMNWVQRLAPTPRTVA